jgi:hypothetical protein
MWVKLNDSETKQGLSWAWLQATHKSQATNWSLVTKHGAGTHTGTVTGPERESSDLATAATRRAAPACVRVRPPLPHCARRPCLSTPLAPSRSASPRPAAPRRQGMDVLRLRPSLLSAARPGAARPRGEWVPFPSSVSTGADCDCAWWESAVQNLVYRATGLVLLSWIFSSAD